MKDERKTEIKVGLMSLAGILIFLWILGWAKDFSLTSTEKELLIKFPEVAGLEIGDYVTVNGVRKGNVQDIAIQKENVLVKISLKEEVDLREDAVFAIMMLDLMGGKKIEVKPGFSETKLNFERIQNGQFYADIPTVMSLLGSVQDDLLASIKEIRVTLTSLNRYLTDEEMNQDVKSSLKSLNEVLSKMNSFIDKNRENLEYISQNTADLTKSANDMLSANREGINQTFIDLQKVLSNADSLLTKLNNFASETVNRKNNAGKLLYDEEFVSKIVITLDQLNELTKIINEQLKAEGLKVDAEVDLF